MFIIGIILGAGVVVFVLQNLSAVSVSFLSWQFDGSLAVIVILAILLGMIISWLLAIPDLLRLSDLKRHNNKLQKDLDTSKQKLSDTEGRLSEAETPVIVERNDF